MTEYETFAQREREGWADDTIIGAYVDGFGPVVDAMAGRLAELALAEGPDEALDLCCGQGTLTAMLSYKVPVTGVDFSAAMLMRAAKSVPSAKLIEADIRSLPFEDASVMVATCNHGLMHVPDRGAALAEIARVLAPGGRLVFSNWSPPEENPVFAIVMGTVKAHLDATAPPIPAPDFFELARPEEADRLIAAAGLEVVARERMELPWRLSTAGELVRMFSEGTVGMRMLVRSQPPERTASIRKAVTAKIEAGYRSGEGYAVPVAAVITTVVKPD